MNTKFTFCFFLFFCLCTIKAKEGIVTTGTQMHQKSTMACTTGNASEYLDVNNVKARLFNTGGLFFKDTDEYYVPKASLRKPMFSTGIWIGGLTVTNELRVAGTQYRNWEFWPGPIDNNGNPPTDCTVYDKIYKLNKADITSYENGFAPTPDLANWPRHLGAPVRDGDGNLDNYNLAGGDRPAFPGDNLQGVGGADEMLWWVMNDLGGTHVASGTSPIGIEVQVTAYAFNRSGYLGDTTFYRYVLKYKGSGTFKDVYFSIFADPDLGDSDDDYIGVDTTLDLGFTWNADNADGTGVAPSYGTPPPAIGFDILRGINHDINGDGMSDEMGLSGFVYFDNGTCNVCDPTNGTERYNYMRSRMRNGVSFTSGGNGTATTGTPTNFVYPGAITSPGTYWAENANTAAGGANTPSDRRFVISIGPFSMNPGERKSLTTALIFAQGGSNIDSVQRLKLASQSIQQFFNSYPVVATDSEIPNAAQIERSYPNPFSTKAYIPYTLQKEQSVAVKVYNVLGQEVWLKEVGLQMPGKHTLEISLDNLSTGLYFSKIFMNGQLQKTVSMTFIP